MSSVLPIFYSERFLNHHTGYGHAERPARLTSIVEALKTTDFAERLDWRHPTAAPQVAIAKAHTPSYIEAVNAMADAGGGYLDPDTPISRESYEIALLAAGAWLNATETILATAQPAAVLCRPPGHHAEAAQGMGFCVFNNAAIAALWALEQPGIERVAVLDWDVHHGNGTQAILSQNPKAAFVSLHQLPLYPHTGTASETGDYANVCNVPLAAGGDWAVYEAVWQQQVQPFLARWQPDILLVSAGFDCAAGDPLAGMQLLAADFGRLTRLCLAVTPRCVFGLEGGYNLENLANGWRAVAAACLGDCDSERLH